MAINLQPKIYNLKSVKGFTLMELIIVIGITIIISSMLSINLFGAFQNRNLSSDAQTIAFTLKAARDKAISQEDSNQWGVYFDNVAGKNFYTLFEGANYVSSSPTNFKKILSSGVKFSQPSSGTSTKFIFSKLSGLPAATGSIIINLQNNAANSRTIIVTPSGEINY